MTPGTRSIRKTTGNFLEDFAPGQIFRHKSGKTITAGLFTTFTEFSMTTNPLSKNARYAKAFGFRDLVCPPGLVMLVAFSQTVEDISENARANLEYIDMRFGAPVYIGDTIEVETKILGVRSSSSRPNLGIVHVQSIARKNIDSSDETIVMAWQRKAQVYKKYKEAIIDDTTVDADTVTCKPTLPEYDPLLDHKRLSHLTNHDSYFEDFDPATIIRHSRGRTITKEHVHMTAVLDNTSQVHSNQQMIDFDPQKYVGGQLIVFGGIPFVICLGLSCPDVWDNSLGDLSYGTGRHTAPLFAGETIFAETEILGKRDYALRPDVGVVETRLLGHKFVRSEKESRKGDPPGWQKVQIFELEREILVKRRSHYESRTSTENGAARNITNKTRTRFNSPPT